MMSHLYHDQFDRHFMTFDPFRGREPWNQPDHFDEPEDRFCECCETVLATDDKEVCKPCAEICAADDAAHAKEDELKNILKTTNDAQRDPRQVDGADRR